MSPPPPESSPHSLEFHDVTVAYGRRPVLWNIDLTVDGPGLFGIIGPNGAGKSTLLKAALGLVPLAGGSVQFFGQPLRMVRTRVGYVPQRETVDWDFPVSVFDVVLMGTYGRLGWFRRPGPRERELARDCLLRVGLADVANRQIGRLSGGQQQRLALARALLRRPRLLILDEPTVGLDPAQAAEVLDLALGVASGATVLLITHDLAEARRCERVVWLSDGRIRALSAAEVADLD